MPKRRGRPSTPETRLSECAAGHHRYAWKDRQKRATSVPCLDCGRVIYRRARRFHTFDDVGPGRDTLRLNPREKSS